MFNEREMSKAIDWLFELFSPEDYEGYDEDEIGYAGGLCLPEVCTALRGAAQTVYQYSVAGGYEKCFNYRGMELFDQRACLIISDVEQAVLDEIKTTYETELWLMEDMNFAIVRCVSMLIGSDDTGYVTEYRAFKKILKNAEDLFFSPEELIEELESMCVPQWEHEATIYALDAICKEHQARALTKNEKPSVLAQLKKFKEIVAAIPKKVREKKQERDL